MDNATHTLTAQRILAECAEIGDGWQLGLRCIPEMADVGDVLDPSYRWVDGECTDEQLAGTSAIGLRTSGNLDSPVSLESVERALQLIQAYHGVAVAVVAGEDLGSGEDVGEVVIGEAEIMLVG